MTAFCRNSEFLDNGNLFNIKKDEGWMMMNEVLMMKDEG
jgi:hypothetical protein